METKRKGTVLENLAGQKFNRYTVIELDKEKSNNKFWKIFWRCRCDCGSEKSVSSQALKSGTTKSCGCLHRERAKDRCGKLFKKRVLQHPRIAILQQYKYRAKRFNRLFAIPEDVFFNLIEQKCYYCGSEPNNEAKTRPSKHHESKIYLYNGLDRVDTSRGYETDNVIPCCLICNFAKNDLTQKEFFNWIEKIHTNRKKP